MIAQIQRITVISLLLSAFLWAIWAMSKNQPGWAALGVAVILGWYAVILGLEFLLMHFQNRKDPVARASAKQVLKAWVKEIWTAPIVFCWRQPFRSQAILDQDSTLPDKETHQKTGVLLVHGFMCNRGVWNTWLREFKILKLPFIAVNLEPVFGSIDDYADQIESAISRLLQATGKPPIIVAHSMGGLAVRAWLVKFKSEASVNHIITIASPHQGTWLGRFAININTQQMRPLSSWLNNLRVNEKLIEKGKFTCFYSNCDNIVFPASNACLPGARNIHLAGIAHLEMTHNKEILQELLCRVTADKSLILRNEI